jgi:type IV pilus assembly protein PilW
VRQGFRIHRARGLSLVELMVALVLGSVLIGGALYTYQQGRSSFAVNERLAQLQDAGRYAISVIEPEIELAGYLGFTNTAYTVRLVENGDTGRVIATARQMRHSKVFDTDPAIVPVPNLPAGAHACGANFAVDVLTPVRGTNGTYDLACGTPHPVQAGSDTLTVRHVAPTLSAPTAGRIQMYSPRRASRSAHFLFGDGNAPGAIDTNNEVRNFVVRTYYVATSSVGRPGLPALRVKTLSERDGAVEFTDEEVIPGVEDLQVQFGIDTGDYDDTGAVHDLDGDGIPESDGRATRYVNPDFSGLHKYQVVAVRLWVRVRGEQPEVGFLDNKAWRYADRTFTANADERRFRRTVMSRTVTLRNARTL